MNDGKKQRRMRHLLLNRRFQLKYTAMIVGIASLVSIVLGVYLMEMIRENSRMLKLEAEFDEVLQAQLSDADARVAAVLIGSFLFFNIVLGVLAVFITHRMAGPIFVMQRYVRELGQGKLPKVRKLRKGDEFVELVDTMSETVKMLEANTRREVASMEHVLTVLDAEHSQARDEIQAILEIKRGMLARFEDPNAW
jgi:signal transduction histidine kinase